MVWFQIPGYHLIFNIYSHVRGCHLSPLYKKKNVAGIPFSVPISAEVSVQSVLLLEILFMLFNGGLSGTSFFQPPITIACPSLFRPHLHLFFVLISLRLTILNMQNPILCNCTCSHLYTQLSYTLCSKSTWPFWAYSGIFVPMDFSGSACKCAICNSQSFIHVQKHI